VILDTNAVSALLAGDSALGDVLSADERHHLPVIVIGEYRFGLLGSKQSGPLRGLLETLIRESVVLPVDEKTAAVYAQVRDELRQKGKPIPENDLWIAALARQHRQPVVTRDSHLDEVSELRRVGW
jgi:tRNA(fMet)-specific endonuclease VapC